jgi:hypothetical protein
VSEGTVQVAPDSTGKKVGTQEVARTDGSVVERQETVIADASNTESGGLAEVRAQRLQVEDRNLHMLENIDAMIKIAGRVRGSSRATIPENREDEQLHLNNRGDQIIAQGLPELTELVRLGDSWQINSTTGQAALTALPTTTPASRSRTTSRRRQVLRDRLLRLREEVVDATQTDVTALFAMLNKRTSTAPSGGTAENGVDLACPAAPNYAGAPRSSAAPRSSTTAGRRTARPARRWPRPPPARTGR